MFWSFPVDLLIDVRFERISAEMAREIARGGITSAVDHKETAAIFSNELGVAVETNHAKVGLEAGDEMLVGLVRQCHGPQLEEGAVTPPEEASIIWILVLVR